jgi:hypothetical protein
MNFLLFILIVTALIIWGNSLVARQKLLFEQYVKSKTLLRENLDDVRRREAFLRDARAYYQSKNPGAANEMKNEMIVTNELNALTRTQLHQHIKTGAITNVNNNYHLPKLVEDDNSVDKIERKILNICAGKEEGASIVDIITETRAPRIKIIPVLEQLQKDELILIDNNEDGTVVYKLY